MATCSGEPGGHRYKNNENYPSWARQETIRNHRGKSLVRSCNSLGSTFQRHMSIKNFLHVHIDYCHCHIEYISSLVVMYFKWYCINAIFKNFLHLIHNYWCIKSVTTPKTTLEEVVYLLHLFIVFNYCLNRCTTTAVAETIAENPKKTARLEVQVGSSSSSSESSLKGLFEEILQEHDEEHAAGTTSTCSTSDICDGANYLTLRQPIPVLGSQPSSVSHSGCHCCKVSLRPWYQCGQWETVQHSIYHCGCKKKQARRRESRNAHFPEEELAIVIEIVSNTKFPQQCVT